MRKILFISIILALLCGCNSPDKKIITNDDLLSQKQQENDSLLILFDSIMQIKIEVPPLIDSTLISIDCLESFNKLARETSGNLKVLVNSKLVTQTITEIIESNSIDNSDLMILIDKTSSMQDDLTNIKKGLGQILNSIENFKNLRLAIGTYGDKNYDGSLWYDFKNFETNFSETKKYINSISITDGGDFPESVYDGIYKAFQENFWKSNNKRIVILIGDAPSLDSTLSDHSLKDIIAIAKSERINMNFYPIVLSPEISENTEDKNEHKMEHLSLIENAFPNPTYGAITLNLTNSDELVVELINQKGEIFKTFVNSTKNAKIDLSEQPPGLYIIRVYDKSKNYDTRKIILRK